MVWRIVQDHIDPNLLFAATEYGLYFSNNQGEKWMKFYSGLPTISIRDLAIQKRENDLVLATFGRGFYVLDDYSPLRKLNKANSKGAILFDIKDAIQYNPIQAGTSSQGSSYYSAENPQYGAIISYYIPESTNTSKAERKKAEKELNKLEKDIPFPGWNELDKENSEKKSNIILEIKDSNGEIVTRINGSSKKGINRIAWDLTKPLISTINSRVRGRGNTSSIPVESGLYSAQIFKNDKGNLSKLSEMKNFNVSVIRENILINPLESKLETYINDLTDFKAKLELHMNEFRKSKQKLSSFEIAIKLINSENSTLIKDLNGLYEYMVNIDSVFSGNESKKEIGEKDYPTIMDRLSVAQRGFYGNSYGPTKLHMDSFEIAKNMWNKLKVEIQKFNSSILAFENKLNQLGTPSIID